jgi:NAD(P)H-hydrate epimerase
MGMCLRSISRQQARHLDMQASGEFGLSTLVLMENAGRGAAGWLAELAGIILPQAGGRLFAESCSTEGPGSAVRRDMPGVVILCGSGNNGGDGGVVARHLDAWGFSVRVIWFAHGTDLHGDAATQWDILQKSRVDQQAWYDVYTDKSDQAMIYFEQLITGADWVVDGLLGTGLSRPVEGALRMVIETINRSGTPVLSLDLPSGLDADTGQPLGVAVRARATATFVAPKRGFSVPGAREYTGKVAVIDIGLPRPLVGPFCVD